VIASEGKSVAQIAHTTIQCMGSVGTVFHACCLLETTTNSFHIRTLPNPPDTRLFSSRRFT
jgi:hypothetical protein